MFCLKCVFWASTTKRMWLRRKLNLIACSQCVWLMRNTARALIVHIHTIAFISLRVRGRDSCGLQPFSMWTSSRRRRKASGASLAAKAPLSASHVFARDVPPPRLRARKISSRYARERMWCRPILSANDTPRSAFRARRRRPPRVNLSNSLARLRCRRVAEPTQATP